MNLLTMMKMGGEGQYETNRVGGDVSKYEGELAYDHGREDGCHSGDDDADEGNEKWEYEY